MRVRINESYDYEVRKGSRGYEGILVLSRSKTGSTYLRARMGSNGRVNLALISSGPMDSSILWRGSSVKTLLKSLTKVYKDSSGDTFSIVKTNGASYYEYHSMDEFPRGWEDDAEAMINEVMAKSAEFNSDDLDVSQLIRTLKRVKGFVRVEDSSNETTLYYEDQTESFEVFDEVDTVLRKFGFGVNEDSIDLYYTYYYGDTEVVVNGESGDQVIVSVSK